MREILDAPGFDKPEEEEIKTNFQKWAFRLLILTMASMIFNELLLPHLMNPTDEIASTKVSGLLSLLIILSLCFGLFSAILSVVYKEDKNFRFTISAIGYFIIIMLAFA